MLCPSGSSESGASKGSVRSSKEIHIYDFVVRETVEQEITQEHKAAIDQMHGENEALRLRSEEKEEEERQKKEAEDKRKAEEKRLKEEAKRLEEARSRQQRYIDLYGKEYAERVFGVLK